MKILKNANNKIKKISQNTNKDVCAMDTEAVIITFIYIALLKSYKVLSIKA